MTLIDEAISGAEALADEAAELAASVTENVAGEAVEVLADIADRSLDVVADAAEEAVERVRRVGLRRLFALVLVVTGAIVAWKVWQLVSDSEDEEIDLSSNGSGPAEAAAEATVLDVSAQ